MTRTLTFDHSYPVDPDRLFALVTDLDTLDAVTKPWVQFHHLPSGPVKAGQVIDVAVSFLGLLPARPYTMRIVFCDGQTRRMRSEESGMGALRLLHTVAVLPETGGARLIDRIEIDAGWKTPTVAALAWLSYRWRHHLRLRLLRQD